MSDLDSTPTQGEFKVGVKKSTNDNAHGLNKDPPSSFKAMKDTNLRYCFNFILEFFEGTIDFEEWHEGQIVPVPKSGDLSDSNKWSR